MNYHNEAPIRSSQQLGQLISAARRRKGLTQREVAADLGVTQYWISRVERGQQKAWIGAVLRLATWLDIEIIGRLDDPANPRQPLVLAEYPDINEIVKPKR